MTRRNWWAGVAVVVLAVLLHALIPRYEYRNVPGDVVGMFTRIDRWTGSAELVSVAVTDGERSLALRTGARLLRPARKLEIVDRKPSSAEIEAARERFEAP